MAHAQPILYVSDLVREGASRREIESVTRALTRVAVGAYADLAGRPAEQAHLLRAEAIQRRLPTSVASHLTAAVAHGLPVRARQLERVHLTRTDSSRGNPKSGPGYRMHQGRVADADLATVRGLTVTGPSTTILDCARILTGDWGVVIADAALHAGLVRTDELAEAARRFHRVRGAARARTLPGLASSRAESPGESLLRMRLLRMGLVPEEQAVLHDVPGRPRVDFLVEGVLVVEFDGAAKYTLEGDVARAHWLEKQRHDRIGENGRVVIRVTWGELWDEGGLRTRVYRALQRARRHS